MFVFRLCSRKYQPTNSEGARLNGGRWNQVGTPVIYAAATESLAAIEIIAHYGAIASDYQVVAIEIPDGLKVETVERGDLPDGWPDGSDGSETAELGTNWARSLRTVVLRVPSAAIRNEYNYVLNPLHPDFTSIKFSVRRDQRIDPRLSGTAPPPAL